MLTIKDLHQQLHRLKDLADRAAKALAAEDAVPPLQLAEAAVELGKLGDKLGKLADRLQDNGRKASRKR
jgi:hypothetical protein